MELNCTTGIQLNSYQLCNMNFKNETEFMINSVFYLKQSATASQESVQYFLWTNGRNALVLIYIMLNLSSKEFIFMIWLNSWHFNWERYCCFKKRSWCILNVRFYLLKQPYLELFMYLHRNRNWGGKFKGSAK